jgi:site-specific recombinase XerD
MLPTTIMCNVKKLKNNLSDKTINWVTETEVKALIKATQKTRYPVRNKLIILMLYRHGLRESELCKLKLDYIDFEQSKIFIKRLKGSNDFTHPITGDELRLIRRYLRIRTGKKYLKSPWLFLSERGNQLSRFTVIKTLEVCYKKAGLRKITPHMLRHGCGYYLANKGFDLRVIQDYLGHKNVQNTVIYTRLSGKQFEGMWE